MDRSFGIYAENSRNVEIKGKEQFRREKEERSGGN
jgi:hypothetical protein